jgi:hypothetical protein
VREELLAQRGVFATLLAKLPFFRTCEESSVRALHERYLSKQAERKDLETRLLDATLRVNFASVRILCYCLFVLSWLFQFRSRFRFLIFFAHPIAPSPIL